MGATSIHVQAVKPGSEIHNFREKELDYVRPELSHLNESWVGDSISHRLESAKQRYLDTVGQKMQAKAAPIREGVIVIKQETTMQELQQFATVCKERFGIEAFIKFFLTYYIVFCDVCRYFFYISCALLCYFTLLSALL